MFPKQEDTLKRKRNILNFFKSLPEENEKLKRKQAAQRQKEEEERRRLELEEEEKRRREEAEERQRQINKPPRTISVPKKRGGRPSEYTAQATIHRRTHEEL